MYMSMNKYMYMHMYVYMYEVGGTCLHPVPIT